MSFADAAAAVLPVDDAAAVTAQQLHERLTKPPGSLGVLEDIGVQLASIARACPPPVPNRVTVAVFAADHGVVADGVSAWPQEVTAQMLANFAAGGAAINVLARHLAAQLVVVDVGVATPIPGTATGVIDRKIRYGTANLAVEAAMTSAEAAAALDAGAEVATTATAAGAQLLVTGDMGIGNTTAAAAIVCALTGAAPAATVGRGAGADEAAVHRKVEAVRRGLARVRPDASPLDVLAEVGGLEIAALAGLCVGGAAAGVPIVVDGAIAAAGALVAVALCPATLPYLIAGHRSPEPCSGHALDHLRLTPLLDLGLRLGEGSGAALAVPLVQASARLLGEMATFDRAGIDSGGTP